MNSTKVLSMDEIKRRTLEVKEMSRAINEAKAAGQYISIANSRRIVINEVF